MTFIVEWTDEAREDIDHILEYYWQQGGNELVLSAHQKIISQVESLRNFPERCREGRIPGTREYVISRLPFIAVIRIESGTVFVVHLIHTAKQYPPSDTI